MKECSKQRGLRHFNIRNWCLFGAWSLVLGHSVRSEAGFGAFGFADGAVGVVDEVVDLVETAEEHGVTVDDDVVEPGVLHRAGEGGEAGGLIADAVNDDFEAGAGVGLFAGDATG
jgi:hypothetical protein